MIGLRIRIRKRQRRIDDRFVAAFAQIPVANISDCMARMSAGGPRLRPMVQRIGCEPTPT